MQCIIHEQSLWHSSASHFSVVAEEELKNQTCRTDQNENKMLFKKLSHIGYLAFNNTIMQGVASKRGNSDTQAIRSTYSRQNETQESLNVWIN